MEKLCKLYSDKQMLANLILSFCTYILKEILSLVWILTKFNKV